MGLGKKGILYQISIRSLLFSILLLAIFQCDGQEVHKKFFNEEGTAIDSASAHHYVLYSLHKDSLWAIRSFDMKNNPIMSGTFIDEALTIPHGLFKFYVKQKILVQDGDTISRDTTIFLSKIGQFDNGQQTGRWIDYFNTGKPEFINTFVRDTLNGPFVSYAADSANTIVIKGNYKDGMREGEWEMFRRYEHEISDREFFKKGELIKHLTFPSNYVEAVRPLKVDDYLKKNLVKFLVPKYKHRVITVKVAISAEGKITNGYLVVERQHTRDPDGHLVLEKITPDDKLLLLNPEIKKIIMDCPFLFVPAYDKRSNKKLEDSMAIGLYVQKSWLEIPRY